MLIINTLKHCSNFSQKQTRISVLFHSKSTFGETRWAFNFSPLLCPYCPSLSLPSLPLSSSSPSFSLAALFFLSYSSIRPILANSSSPPLLLAGVPHNTAAVCKHFCICGRRKRKTGHILWGRPCSQLLPVWVCGGGQGAFLKMRNIQMRLINTGAFQRLAVLCSNLEAFVTAPLLSMDSSHNQHLILLQWAPLLCSKRYGSQGPTVCWKRSMHRAMESWFDWRWRRASEVRQQDTASSVGDTNLFSYVCKNSFKWKNLTAQIQTPICILPLFLDEITYNLSRWT